MRKSWCVFGILLALIFLLNFNTINALGVSPGRIQIDFYPGIERTFTYTVLNVDQDTEVKLSVSGDLAHIGKLDRDTMIGPGEFNVIISLPAEIETPGPHRIGILVEEAFDEELGGQIGTKVNIITALDVFVPYPGKFIDANLVGHDVNVEEPITFNLELTVRGDQNVTAFPRIEISDSERVIETLFLQERDLPTHGGIRLKKILDTVGYLAGDYKALAVVEYGGEKPALDEEVFRIGSLNVDLINHTKKIVIGGFVGFEIDVASGWNDPLESVSAEVSISQNDTFYTKFKTSAESLSSFEDKTLIGFFDSSNFTAGIYDVDINISYFDKELGLGTNEFDVQVEFVEKQFDTMTIVYIVGGLIILIVLIILARKYFFKKKR